MKLLQEMVLMRQNINESSTQVGHAPIKKLINIVNYALQSDSWGHLPQLHQLAVALDNYPHDHLINGDEGLTQRQEELLTQIINQFFEDGVDKRYPEGYFDDVKLIRTSY